MIISNIRLFQKLFIYFKKQSADHCQWAGPVLWPVQRTNGTQHSVCRHWQTNITFALFATIFSTYYTKTMFHTTLFIFQCTWVQKYNGLPDLYQNSDMFTHNDQVSQTASGWPPDSGLQEPMVDCKVPIWQTFQINWFRLLTVGHEFTV